jgi:hypothetical protein
MIIRTSEMIRGEQWNAVFKELLFGMLALIVITLLI